MKREIWVLWLELPFCWHKRLAILKSPITFVFANIKHYLKLPVKAHLSDHKQKHSGL